jgi:hypothetical protein
MVYSKFHVGDRCKCLHPYAYRGEEPFTIVKIVPNFGRNGRKPIAAYVVKYDDGAEDQIPVKHEGGYEMVCLTNGTQKTENQK